MPRWIWIVTFAAALCAQNPSGRLEFEVASIKPSTPLSGQRVAVGLRIDGAQVHCSSLSLREYLQMAYQMRDYQISGPEWLASERFDISAKLPEGSKREQVREMLQSLLQDRFQLKAHRDHKEFSVYGLVVGKGGLKMKASEEGPETSSAGPLNLAASGAREGVTIQLGDGATFTAADNRFVGTKLTMANAANLLGRFVDRPVIDMTNLPGRYDFTLEFSPEDFRAMQIRSALAAGVALPPQALKLIEESPGDSLFAAVEKLGLKLEKRKAQLEILVIDQIEKAPSEN
jgi:uncharacterized protein (TIGR03435 family)